MKSAAATLYFIAHVLPPHLDGAILLLKQKLHQLYSCSVGLKSPAHITLIAPFWLSPQYEAGLLQDVAQLSQNTNVFPIAAANFSSFGKRTLFIALQPNDDLHSLKASADKVFTTPDRYGIKKETRPFHPHITLATRDLKPAHFDAAWLLFKNKIFEEGWQAAGISVLRHNGKYWDVTYTSHFSK